MDYQRTFLRSTLARDPFALGDLGPLDVLRIESEFPDLFNATSAPLSKGSTTDAPNLRSTKQPIIPITTKSKPATLAPPSSTQSYGHPGLGPRRVVTSHQPPTTTIPALTNNLRNSKVAFSTRSHQPPPFRKSVPSFSSSPARVQYVSIDELRNVLKEFLEDKKKRFADELQLPTSMKGVQKSALECEHAKRLIQLECSRKLNKNWDMGAVTANQGRGDIRGDGGVFDSKSSPRNSIVKKGPISGSMPRSNLTLKKSECRQSPKKTESAAPPKAVPGFIKPGIPKSRRGPVSQPNKVSNGPTKTVLQLDRTDRNKKQRHIETLPTELSPSLISGRPEEQRFHIGRKRNDEEDRNKSKPSLSPETRQIYIKKSHSKPPPSSSSESEDVNGPADTFLSYQQVKFAQNLATAYEKVGLLKKISTHAPKLSNATIDKPLSKEKMVQTELFAPFSPHKEAKIAVNAESHTPTQSESNILETIAKELVYVEIMKHLQRIQQENTELKQHEESGSDQHVGQKSYLCNSGSMLEGINIEELVLGMGRLSAIPEICEIDLITPNLSDSSIADKHIIATPDRVFLDECLDIIPTPDLSTSRISRRAQFVAKDSPGNLVNNDATDCSEISDFVSSFNDKDILYKTPHRTKVQFIPDSKVEFTGDSEQLATPELSGSNSKLKPVSQITASNIIVQNIPSPSFLSSTPRQPEPNSQDQNSLHEFKESDISKLEIPPKQNEEPDTPSVAHGQNIFQQKTANSNYIPSPNTSLSNFVSPEQPIKSKYLGLVSQNHLSSDNSGNHEEEVNQGSDTLSNVPNSSKIDDPAISVLDARYMEDEPDSRTASFTLDGLLSDGEFTGKECTSLGELISPQRLHLSSLPQTSGNSSTSKGSTVYFASAGSHEVKFGQQLPSSGTGISVGEFFGLTSEKK